MTVNPPSILSLFQLTDEQRTAAMAQEVAISVTAGAGSGKTRSLTGRFLALLESGLELRSLVAITFTEKAAREMRNRIRAITTQWLEQAGAAPNRERWEEVFSALDSARISTIHSLCAAILRTHPVEAELDPGFKVLDEGQSGLWQARAVEEGLAWATTEPDVAALFGPFQEGQLRRLLTDLLAQRLDAAEVFSNRDDQLLERWSGALEIWLGKQWTVPAWQESLETLAGIRAQAEDDKLEMARRAVLACWEQVQQVQDWDTRFAALLELRGAISTGGRSSNWSPDELEAARQAMRALRDQFDLEISRLVDKKKPPAWTLDRQGAALLPPVHRLFAQTQAIYQGYKDEVQALDFDDLEQRTAHLLTTNQAVRARWQQINALLLVDEFQDTNQRQRQIVYALAGFEPTSGPDVPQKPGSLFIVGDAKQSIYRFRGADVTVFRGVQADIQAAGGRLINFDLTFRAHQPLVELTNALLAPLMPGQDDPARPYDVPFTPLVAHRHRPRLDPPYLEFHLGLGQDKPAGRMAAACGLADRLHRLQEAGQLQWQDVALLFRASTAFATYEDALEQAGIPFVTVAGRGFYDRPEVRDLLNALAALADPSDDLALAGLLRSPTIGLSDAALRQLRYDRAGNQRLLWNGLNQAEALTDLAEADRDRAVFARQLIAGLHHRAGRVSVAHLLKTLLDATHYRAALRLAPGGERLRRNVDKLLADAHQSELVGVAEFLEYIEALGDVGARQSEAPTEAGGAVQLMTIHKAKGLEFPVVVLADAGYTGGYRPTPFYLDRDLGLVLHLSDEEAQPATYRLAACREAEQEAAEERRLLYVAATRAEEKLIISGDGKLSTAKAHPGQLLLSGWLKDLAAEVGLAGTCLPGIPATAQEIPLAWQEDGATCTVYPPPEGSSRPVPPETGPAGVTLERMPDLLAPLVTPPEADLDDKLQERESDPPPRVWRVVPRSQYEVPAWVVGSLTHIALRRWRFPDTEGFTDFLRPFALEAGLTDRAAIDIALSRVSSLLARFQAHPLYADLSTAERHHELPYSLMAGDGQVHSGLLDLLFRTSPEADWTIAEFKTDRLPAGTDLATAAHQKGYDRQVAAYRQAVAQQLGTTPLAWLVFLNVGQTVQVLSLDPPPG